MERHPLHLSPVRALAVCTSIVLAVAVLATYGVSSASAATAKQIRHRECTAVADVLSDGPDPDADSVGYAEAQILPLEHLTVADRPLRRAVRQLDSAYKAFNSSNGAASAAVKVTAAEKKVNAICPNAAP